LWRKPSLPGSAAWLLLGLAASLLLISATGMAAHRQTRRAHRPFGRRYARSIIYAGFAAMCILTLSSCGLGDAGNTSVTTSSQTLTGNITVTATSGVLQHVTTLPITIRPKT
jgi:hypothetical protein